MYNISYKPKEYNIEYVTQNLNSPTIWLLSYILSEAGLHVKFP